MSLYSEHEPTLDKGKLRDPQLEGYVRIRDYFAQDRGREVAAILPVGCGKSGLIALAPFAVHSRRALVVAPNLRLRNQLFEDVNVSSGNNFYYKLGVLQQNITWEPVLIASGEVNMSDLEAADIVVTNIQQLAGDENRWLDRLAPDFFDLILFDEAHHNVAPSWERLRGKFPEARIVSLTATPIRGDGAKMAGEIVYAYPVVSAMERGYIKYLRGVMLNPSSLRYLEFQGGNEVEISLEEVRKLAATDAGFRRAIVMSRESLGTIVDASIARLNHIREKSGDGRHKIIASALNMTHCTQVVRAYEERRLRVDFVHSDRGEEENERVLRLLDNHEIDVIVQVRMLGEGFNHPYLSVAAICSVFGSLSPFVQFVGRIMRTISGSPINEGVVVFHAGSNIASTWDDFREYSKADQNFFADLLPLEGYEFDAGQSSIDVDPIASGPPTGSIQAQERVTLEELVLVDDDVARALDVLLERGIGPSAISSELELRRIHVSGQSRRQASRGALDQSIRTLAGRELLSRGLKPYAVGPRPPETNFVTAIKSINMAVAQHVEQSSGSRGEWSNEDYAAIDAALEHIAASAVAEAFDGR